MAKTGGQKIKLLYIKEYLEQNSDENHVVTVKDMIDYLASREIRAERKSIYNDLDILKAYGMEIIYRKEKPEGYYLASREFELPELKLLVDAVQASRFITEKKSSELIHKLETLTDKNNAKQLQRQVFVQDRIKAMNESIYYNVDEIQNGLSLNSQISFQYYGWNLEKKLELKHNGEVYVVSPGTLIWADENYYLVAYEERTKTWKHFRVDKMRDITVLKEKRSIEVTRKKMDMSVYGKRTFGMFSGTEETVRIRLKNHLIGVFLDRFGQDISLRKDGEDHLVARMNVVVSSQFYGWLFGLGREIKILSPKTVKDEYRRYLEETLKNQLAE